MLKTSVQKNILIILVLVIVGMLTLITSNATNHVEATANRLNQSDADNPTDVNWYLNHTVEAQQIVQKCHENTIQDSQNCINAEFATKLTGK
ncbi:EexN family lipoprotein [Methylomonas sp. AM2-LC]|uniref:EexN family lipoprotein n=1 Tax=Methylomonas sp. AM2-LC TaxID=3153301 RepID=UPI003263EA0B